MPIIGRDLALAKGLPINEWFLHSVLFDKSKWTKEKAKQWLKDNKYLVSRYHEAAYYQHWNQAPEIRGASYKTKKMKNGIDLVYEYFV